MPSFDESFRAFCTRAGVPIKSVTPSKNAPAHGDQCTINWGIWAKDEDDAREICKDMGVFYSKSWKRDSDGYALCEYEAILICKPGFIQIRGKCYKVVKHGELRKRSDAEVDCKEEKSEVFKYFDEEVPRLIPHFFENLEAIWAIIPDGAGLEVFYDEQGKGTNYMVAYGNSHFFGLGYGSLVKVTAKRLATVLCEYTPPDTVLSFRAKLEKIKPYIFPAHSDGVQTFWRTWIHHDERWNGVGTTGPRTLCQKSMKPLLNSRMGNVLDMTRVKMQQMPKELKKSMPLSIVPFGDCNGRNPYLFGVPIDYTECGPEVTSQEYNVVCDRKCGLLEYKRLYHAIFHENGNDYLIVRALRGLGPYWCDIDYQPPKTYKPCPDGWFTYEREDGSRHCHIHVYKEKTFNDAQSHCKTAFQAEVSSFAEINEFHLLQYSGPGWINAYKTITCKVEVSGKCSKEELFSFRTKLGDLSYDGKKMIGDLMAPGQPDKETDTCVNMKSDGLYDSNCNDLKPSNCGKEAEEVQ